MFKRLANLIRGFFGLFVGGLEKRNPEALLEVEKENLREKISKFNKGLASHAALCERLMSQVKKLRKQRQDLRAKITARLKTGDRDGAAQFAVQLQTIKREVGENNEQLIEAEKSYQELLNVRDVSVKEARAKIEELKRGITDMKTQRAIADLNEMAAGAITDIGGSGDTLNRLHEMVEEERAEAAGRARVARSAIDTSEYSIKKEEQKALADLALADFAAEEGIDIPGLDLGADIRVEKPKQKSAAKKRGRAMGDDSQAQSEKA